MKLKHYGIEIEIEQDTDAQSPSENQDNGLFLVANHRQFFVQEPGEKSRQIDFDELLERFKKTHWIFPLEAYIHSGVRLSFGSEGNFPDRRWDVSQLGFVFVSKKEWRLSKKAKAAAGALINEWNQYLEGDVWGYIVDRQGEHESCWGFYGQDYCISEAKSIAEHIYKRKLKARLERVKAFILNRVPLTIRAAELETA